MSAPVFRELGGIFQLHIATAEDLERIETLDKARWAATSAPVDAFLCDKAFLDYLDADKNGRIRLIEVREARRWLWARLRSRAAVERKSDALDLADLDPSCADTAPLTALAKHLLKLLGSDKATRIDLGQVRHFRAEYVKRFPNGDGIVTPEQIEDAAVKAAAEAVIGTVGGAPDLSGAVGVRSADVDAYVERVRAFVAWKASVTGSDAATILPLGDDTAGAAALVAELAPKLDQFFAQCALLALEAGAADRLAATPEQLAAIDVSDPAAIEAWLTRAPVARPVASAVLDLDGPLNTHYAASLRRLGAEVAPKLLGRDGPTTKLDPASWKALQAKVAPFQAWSAGRPAGIAADADGAALLAVVDGPAPDALRALAAKDQGVADDLVQFTNLEKLILYQRWLLEFANNFVSFPRLFSDDDLALFQKGTLIMDGRKMQLVLGVNDRGAHKKIAETSLFFLAYLDLVRKDGAAEVKDSVVAAVTNGVRGGIAVGKRGVFYDRDDVEWDAIVTDVSVQPISLWEAMIAPFLRVRDMIADRFTKLIESQAASAEGNLGAAADGAAATATPPPPAPAPAPAETGGGMQTMLIGGSIAFAALASAGAFVVNVVAGIDPLDALLAIVGIIVVVMAIFGVLGWLKLRRRDLSTMLEAGGWALNGRMRITQYMAEVLTQRPGLPDGAVRRRDAKRSRAGWLVVVVLVLVGAAAAVWWYDSSLFTALLPAPAAEAPAAPVPEVAPAG